MRKIVVAVLIVAMFPAVSYALTNEEIRAEINALLAEISQLQQLMNSITTQGATVSPPPVSGGSSAMCSVSRYPLSRGAVGRDVSLLQQFLKDRGFFSGNITAFFGAITEAALTNFQLQSGIIETRSEGGVFGRRTFNYVLGRFCTSPISTVTPIPTSVSYAPPTQCITPPTIPAITCGGLWVKTYSSACHVGWTCVSTTTQAPATPSNKPPLISAIVGPTHLKPDEAGTWKVDATDPEQGALLYSMVWGDEGATLSQLLNIAREGTKYSSTTSYTHAYAKTGAYTIVAFAKDLAGNDTSASLSVQVRLPEATSTYTYMQLSEDGSCLLNGTKTANSGVIPNPACSGACTYPYLQCISGQWVALPSAPAQSGGGNYACYMDGIGHVVETASSTVSGRCVPSDVTPATKQCQRYLTEQICTANGWVNIAWGGGYINPSWVSVGCTSSNSMQSPYALTGPIRVPGNMRVQGNRCIVDDMTQTNCDAVYVCKRDGWWSVDSLGNEIRKETKAPYIYPENFYPQFAPAY